jgi:DnaK suppressor protein
VKAPATSSQKKGTSAASGAQRPVSSRSAPAAAKKVSKTAPVSKKAAPPAAQPGVKAPPKAAAKPVTKAPAKTSAKVASKPAPKPVTKSAARVPAKPVAKAAVKPAAKPAAKAPVKSATPSTKSKPAAKPAIKPVAKPVGKSSVTPAPSRPVVQPVKKTVVKTAVKPAAAPAVKKPAASAAAKVAAPQPSKASASAVSPTPKPASPAPAPIHVEPTARPLGKRAAKKVMMEQMTQAAVVPTHAPDAAKATFSHMNERSVMTPPVPSTIQKDPKRANNWKTMPVEQLTDQDVQAMPDSEYMNDLQLAYFRRKLAQLRADMLANAGETTEHLREDTVVVPDPADRATIEEEHALELRTRDRERKLLKKIEQAINRIDSGDYGYCEETGEPIGVGRLMARPTASLSLEAQQRRELKQKMFGD